MNNKSVMCAQGNGKKLIIIGIAIIIAAIVFSVSIFSDVEGGRDEDVIATLLVIVEYGGIAVGIFTIVVGVKYSKTYIAIYEDYIQGEGLIKFSRGAFTLKYDRINGAFANKDKLFINSGGIAYKIGVGEYTADKMARYINEKI